MSGPLTGIRIVEFAGIGPGPFAAMLLNDLGAEIVRIDRPGEKNAFEVLSRGRLGVAANLKNPDDQAKVLDLVERADAIIECYRPGVMERLGFGPDVLLARNPKLVYGRMTGWGQTGPLAHAAGHDINYIAITGALHAIGKADAPIPPLNLVGDYGGGAMYLVMGLLSALLSVKMGGVGQVVDCAICDGAASMMAVFAELKAHGMWQDGRERNFLDGSAPYYGTYVCADGEHVSLGPIEPQFWRKFVDIMGLDDPAFADRDNEAQWPALRRQLADIFAARSRAEWCALLEGTDACLAPILPLGEAHLHPHLESRGTFYKAEGIIQPAPAPRFSVTVPPQPQSVRQCDLDAVLKEWAV